MRSLPGGDVVQMNATAEQLRQLGHHVDIGDQLDPDIGGYDILHAFNLETPATTRQQVRRAKQGGVPVFLSTIFFDMPDEIRFENFFQYGGWGPAKKVLGRQISKNVYHLLRRRTTAAQEALLRGVDHLLPNSQLEKECIQRNFKAATNLPSTVIVNGVDPQRPIGHADRFFERYGVQNFLLVVGRIGFLKNQLNLLRALRGWNHPIVLIGQEPDPSYARACHQEAAGRSVLFLPHMDPQGVSDAYAAARVHALPSQKETVGLVSLEAGMAGCRIVATSVGGGAEYLKNWAEYCDPNNLESIRQAVEKAWIRPSSPELATYICQNYTWQKAAAKTVDAYQQALSKA